MHGFSINMRSKLVGLRRIILVVVFFYLSRMIPRIFVFFTRTRMIRAYSSYVV